MKISDIVYKTVAEVQQMPIFDMNEMPRKAKWYLRPLAWLLAFPETWKHHAKIRRHGMKGIKPPYVLLCNHDSFYDFKVATRAIFPHMANYIVAIDGFINREELLRDVGCVLKRKFVPDAPLIKKISHSLFKNKYISAIYPEARYALVGTTAILPDSLGKMVKLLKMPVVTLICHGHHLQQPVWNLKKRNIRTSADLSLILTPEEIAAKTVPELNDIIKRAFYYDDYEYQFTNKLHIKAADRAEGLHKVLYQCPTCRTQGKMVSTGNELRCQKCGQAFAMDTLGKMHAQQGPTPFEHIPAWYEWEREQVHREIRDGKYRVETDVNVDILQNSTGFYRLGVAKFVHDETGFHVTADWKGTKFAIHKKPLENYSVHIEYNYFGKGDGVSISTLHDTYYLFPTDPTINVTKIHFAVEELYKIKVAESQPYEIQTAEKTSS